MRFSKTWAPLSSSDEVETRVPVLDVFLRTANGNFVREAFLVDSGADVSLGPRKLCDLLGIDWAVGVPTQLRGISPVEECTVQGTIHQIEVYVLEAACRITLPFCFAEGDAPLLLGREGFFDAFRIQFDKHHQLTTFETAAPVNP